jgi:hypothetical protein
MSKFRELYDVRDGKLEDINFILATFMRGVYYGNPWFNKIPKEIFMRCYKPVIEVLLTKAVVKVACLKDDTDIILGYSILSQDFRTIHWVYVKSSKLPDGTTWRQKGIAKSLVPVDPVSVSHLTDMGEKLLDKFKQKPIFNPFQE